jgi:uncharacterized membrane protein YphA (DoxX/SURF4 family)
MFPDRLPGAGLLLLRSTAGAVLIAQGVAYLGHKDNPGFLVALVVFVTSLLCLLLLIGFLTRFVAIAAVLASLGTVLFWSTGTGVSPPVNPTTAVLAAAIAIAVSCLGPGAFSLDARIFGRRVIVIPTNVSK